MRRVEPEHQRAASAGQQRAGDRRADDARHVHRHAVERQRARQLRARHHAGHDGGEHRPAHRQADAVEEGEQQQRAPTAHRRATAPPASSRSARPTTACLRSSAGGRRCRPARRSAGRAGTSAACPRSATSATSAGSCVSVVISQAAATSFIHSDRLAASQASHSMRNTGLRQRLQRTLEVRSRRCWAARCNRGSIVRPRRTRAPDRPGLRSEAATAPQSASAAKASSRLALIDGSATMTIIRCRRRSAGRPTTGASRTWTSRRD